MSGEENSGEEVLREEADSKDSMSWLCRKRGVHRCKASIYLKKLRQLDDKNQLTPSCHNIIN